jgi:hypothetical protein
VPTGSALLLLVGYHGISAREDLRKNLIMQGRLLGANVTAAVLFEDVRTATEILSTVEVPPIILEAAVYRLDGSRMAHFKRAGVDPRLDASAPPTQRCFPRATCAWPCRCISKGGPSAASRFAPRSMISTSASAACC